VTRSHCTERICWRTGGARTIEHRVPGKLAICGEGKQSIRCPSRPIPGMSPGNNDRNDCRRRELPAFSGIPGLAALEVLGAFNDSLFSQFLFETLNHLNANSELIDMEEKLTLNRNRPPSSNSAKRSPTFDERYILNIH
jgi:hypothetical protein